MPVCTTTRLLPAYHSAHGLVCLLQNRTRIIEVYKRWLWYVDMRWDHRRMVESNMQNMQLEMAIRSQKGQRAGSWGQSI